MKVKFIQYPKCSTCQNAAKWLANNGVEVEENRDIKLQNPTVDELQQWIEWLGVEISKFFNTSGIKYRELNLKDVVRTESRDELLKLLATDGMLVKRPIVITSNNTVLLGFKPQQWEETLLKK